MQWWIFHSAAEFICSTDIHIQIQINTDDKLNIIDDNN